MSRRLIILLILNLFYPTQAAEADLVYRIDLDPIAGGVQDSLVVQPGEKVLADIVLELTDSTTVDIYGVSVQFDAQELDFWLSGSLTLPLAGFEELATLSLEGTTITGIRAATPITAIGSGPMGPQSFVIAQLHFMGVVPVGGLEDIDLLPFETLLDGSFDNFSQQLAPQFYGARIVLGVPEPSLCGIFVTVGLVTIGTHRRRRRPVIVGRKMEGRKMEGRKIEGRKIEGRKMAGRKMAGRKMEGRKMAGRKMAGRKMEGRKMEGRKMEGRKIESRKMEGRKIEGRKMAGRKMAGRKIEGRKMEGRKMEGRKMEGRKMAGQESSGVNGGSFKLSSVHSFCLRRVER